MNKVLFISPDSENKHTRLNEAFNEIGTCIKAIITRRTGIDDGLLFNKSLFFEVNLFRDL